MAKRFKLDTAALIPVVCTMESQLMTIRDIASKTVNIAANEDWIGVKHRILTQAFNRIKRILNVKEG